VFAVIYPVMLVTIPVDLAVIVQAVFIATKHILVVRVITDAALGVFQIGINLNLYLRKKIYGNFQMYFLNVSK